MDVIETCEFLLSSIKSSNLNFNLQETPFSVHISIRKTFIKDKSGEIRASQIEKVDPSAKDLELKNRDLEIHVNHLEVEKIASDDTVNDLANKLEQAKIEIIELLDEKNKIVKTKGIADNKMAEKQTEMDILRSNTKNNKLENEKLKSELKAAKKVNNANEKKIFSFESRNAKLLENLKQKKTEFSTLLKEKNGIEKEKEKIQKKLNAASSTPSPVNSQLRTPKISTISDPPQLNLQGSLLSNLVSSSGSNSPTNPGPVSLPSTSPCASNNQPEPEVEDEILVEDEDYNIETNNNFKVLSEASKFRLRVIDKANDSEAEHVKSPKIDQNNFKEAFEEFLEKFKKEPQQAPKYCMVATEMSKNGYNMFHVQLRDIRNFSPNLGGFMAAQHKTLGNEITSIIQKFIKDLGLGVPKHGLYFNLDGSK